MRDKKQIIQPLHMPFEKVVKAVVDHSKRHQTHKAKPKRGGASKNKDH